MYDELTMYWHKVVMCVSLLPPSQEKKRLQQKMTTVSSQEERQQLQRQINDTEKSMQGWKHGIEQWQGVIKSNEESLHRLEKEEEEGVLYHYSSKLSQTKQTINYVSH